MLAFSSKKICYVALQIHEYGLSLTGLQINNEKNGHL